MWALSWIPSIFFGPRFQTRRCGDSTEKLLLVHINDAEDLPIEQLRDANRLHVGRGVLPLLGTLETLNGIGYNGFLSIEIFRAEYWRQPLEQVVREAKSSSIRS